MAASGGYIRTKIYTSGAMLWRTSHFTEFLKQHPGFCSLIILFTDTICEAAKFCNVVYIVFWCKCGLAIVVLVPNMAYATPPASLWSSCSFFVTRRGVGWGQGHSLCLAVHNARLSSVVFFGEIFCTFSVRWVPFSNQISVFFFL